MAIVDESTAMTLWDGRDPIGQTVRLPTPTITGCFGW
jgi:hypothetical protein